MLKNKITLRIECVVIGCILLCMNVRAQGLSFKIKESGGMGYFMFGGSTIDIDKLNSRLASKGYPKFSDNFISIGGGGHGIINRIIIGGEGHGLISDELSSGNYKTFLTAGYGFFDLGYIVFSTGALNIYPILGFGGGGMSLEILRRDSPTFDEVLDNPGRNTELSTGGFLLNVALGADYLLVLGKDEKGLGGIVVGIRVGYTYSPIKGDWDLDGNDISGGPKVGITGPYIRLMFGGGGISKQ